MILTADGPHIADHGRWTLGVLIGLPALGLIALIAFLVIVGSIGVACTSPWGDGRGSAIATAVGTAVGSGIVAILIIFLGYWPLDSAYHQHRQVDGTVAEVSSRLVAGDKSTNQKFVVVFQGSPQQFGVDDTRAALVKPGDKITLSCIKSYQYAAQFGYDCNWGRP